MVVPVKTSPQFKAGIPKPVSNPSILQRISNPSRSSYRYDVAPDGKRFLLPTLVGNPEAAPFTVVLNWQAGLVR